MIFKIEEVDNTIRQSALLAEAFGVYFGLAVAMFGVFFVTLATVVSVAERVGDEKLALEFASRKRVPLFHMLLGGALIATGLIVAFAPF